MFAASLSCYKTYWHFLVRKNLLHPPLHPGWKGDGQASAHRLSEDATVPGRWKKAADIATGASRYSMGKTNRCGCPNPLKNQHIHHDE